MKKKHMMLTKQEKCIHNSQKTAEWQEISGCKKKPTHSEEWHWHRICRIRNHYLYYLKSDMVIISFLITTFRALYLTNVITTRLSSHSLFHQINILKNSPCLKCVFYPESTKLALFGHRNKAYMLRKKVE